MMGVSSSFIIYILHFEESWLFFFNNAQATEVALLFDISFSIVLIFNLY